MHWKRRQPRKQAAREAARTALLGALSVQEIGGGECHRTVVHALLSALSDFRLLSSTLAFRG